MSIATKCTCHMSPNGFCNSSVKQCTKLIKMEEKKCICNEPYDSEKHEGGYPHCPVHDKPAFAHEPNFAVIGHGSPELKRQPGPVWVKASERLSRPNEWVFFKASGLKYSGFYCELNGFYLVDSGSLFDPVDVEWLDEQAAPSGEREVAFAVAFNIYCTDSYYYENGYWWHKENHDPYAVDQLYDIFKQQKEG